MKQMSSKHQRFISAEDNELKRIKERKLKELNGKGRTSRR